MKIGCMFKSLLLAVTIIGVAYYLFDKYGEAFYEKSKTRLVEKLSAEIVGMLDTQKNSDYSDLLKENIENLTNEAKEKSSEIDLGKLAEAFRRVKSLVENSVIDEKVYKQITELIGSYEK